MGENPQPSNLLGGDFLALPVNARDEEEALELMYFLMSKEVQEKVVSELTWPAMRMDALGKVQPWQEPHQRVITEALLYPEPVPDAWSGRLGHIYEDMFEEIVDLDEDADLTEVLHVFQDRIRAVGIAQSQCQ